MASTILCLALLATAAADSRPTLLTATKNKSLQKAELKVVEASRRVVEAACAVKTARQQLQDSRREAQQAQDAYAQMQRNIAAKAVSPEHVVAMNKYNRRLLAGRCRVLTILLSFTFLNGLARRSLSSAAPSMVDAGLVSEDRIQAIFVTGFEAFAVGKFAVVPATLLLGVRCRPRPGGAGTGVADALDCAKRVPSNTDGGRARARARATL